MKILKIAKALIWNFLIKIPMIIIWRLFCLPGAGIIAIRYFFPTEWGKERNVATSARHYKNMEGMAPWYSLAFYIGLILLLF